MRHIKSLLKFCSVKYCFRFTSRDVGFFDIKIPVCTKHYTALRFDEKVSSFDDDLE